MANVLLGPHLMSSAWCPERNLNCQRATTENGKANWREFLRSSLYIINFFREKNYLKDVVIYVFTEIFIKGILKLIKGE